MTSLSLTELPTRLDKYIRESTGLSRSVIESILQSQRVQIEGRELTSGAATLVFAGDRVFLDGERIERRDAEHYYLFHKPAGVLTAMRDPHGRACLAPYLAHLSGRVFPVGRLDKATTGLLLLTDDGDLAHMLLHPEFHVPKVYHIDLAEEIAHDDPRLVALASEIDLQDGPARALGVELLGNSRIALAIDEGRKRQVRRMVRAVDLKLEHLHRHRFSNLELDIDEPGEMRELDAAEREELWASVGGRSRVVRRKLSALVGQAERLCSRGRPDAQLEAWLNSARVLALRDAIDD